MALANELYRKGMEVSVLTLEPNSAEFPLLDETLEASIHPNINVHRIRAFNPFKWVKKLFSSSIPAPAFAPKSRETHSANWLTVLRSHLFIPDPRKSWNRRAVKRAIEIIQEQCIDVVITSSPPPSVHLIGLRTKRKTGIHWIADFRDPWTDIFYYSRLGHSKLSRAIDKRLEMMVLTKADQVLAVSWGFARLLSDKLPPEHLKKFHVLTNGMDFDPSSTVSSKNSDSSVFRIVYTGVLAQSYQIEEFLESLKLISIQIKAPSIAFDFYGSAPPQYIEQLEELFDFVHFHGNLPQEKVLTKQIEADALFLIGPADYETTGHIPGKLFEYLGARRPILYFGQPNDDVMRIIQETQAGICLIRGDSPQHLRALRSQIEEHSKDLLPVDGLGPYLRKNQAQDFIELLPS